MKNICHNFYRTIIFNASALLIAKYANVRSQYSDVHFITYHFKYYVITSPVCLESIIAECFTLS